MMIDRSRDFFSFCEHSTDLISNQRRFFDFEDFETIDIELIAPTKSNRIHSFLFSSRSLDILHKGNAISNKAEESFYLDNFFVL